MIYGLWPGSYAAPESACSRLILGDDGGGEIGVFWRPSFRIPLSLPVFVPGFFGRAARGVDVVPSICCLKREKRMRAAWPLDISSWEATRFQSICFLAFVFLSCNRTRRASTYRLQIQLFDDCVEELGRRPVCGHGLAATSRHSAK